MHTPSRDIAERDLLSCVTAMGIIAGTHHFVDLWARDSLFGTFGLTQKKDHHLTKKTIQAFLRHQRKDGMVPYLILRSGHNISKYFGRPKYLASPHARFRSNQSGGTVPDGGLMAIIASAQYLRASGDRIFLKTYFRKLSRAMGWYEKRFRGGLSREWLLCEWADAVSKLGSTLYTNVLYWKALGDFAWMAGELNYKNHAKDMTQKQKKIGELLHKKFWTGSYFADWIDYKRQNYFAAHPNMFAVAWGLTTATQSSSILAFAREHCWNGWTLEENYPRYPWWRIPIIQRMAGMADYHNRGCVWLQPGIWYATALHAAGKKQDARHVLSTIGDKIAEYGTVFEVYEKNGTPVNRRLYRSEGPFAWSAGLYTWAHDIIFVK